MIARLTGPDVGAEIVPIAPFAHATPTPKDYVLRRRAQNDAKTEAEKAQTAEAFQQWRNDANEALRMGAKQTLARAVASPDSLRERLTAFWADHFTTLARSIIYRHLVTPFVEEAIRPNLMGSFADMLVAVTTHPIMLLALQQTASMGENSRAGLRLGRGLNENLARELMELHTLGVDGGYSQTDVRELAEVLTGLFYNPMRGFSFRSEWAEPGAETVLGKTYGPSASLAQIEVVLRDLAVHPSTARHIARKLVVHFVSDTPDPNLVASLTDVFEGTGGDLGALTQALLEDPRAWVSERTKVRPPFEFIAASLRALGVPPEAILNANNDDLRRFLRIPLRIMGQPWQSPIGPDGWPEDADAWIIPQSMAGRISWAMQAPANMLESLPDPREFVTTALGPNAPEVVRFAAASAETRSDGVGLVLASPAFQRR